MGQMAAVIGRAGTGKTTWLMGKASEYAPRLITANHQRMLVITRMHGARRKLDDKLKDACRGIPYSVSTIDGFALSIVNRWRTAQGHARPITAVSRDTDFTDGVLGIEADFLRIASRAARLLESQTVGGIIGTTYPLILIDEFQDCYGPLLDFVTALTKHSSVLLAADDFQLLESAVAGCPAVEWARTQATEGVGTIEELMTCHRTSVTSILDAAHCLRENIRSTVPTIPIVCCPNYGPAAWKIIEQLVLCTPARRWTGTCALICPSHDPLLDKVLASCANQLKKRDIAPIRWQLECSAEEDQRRARECLGVSAITCESGLNWQMPSGPLDGMAKQIVIRIQRFARFRGLGAIPYRLVARHVDMAVHEQRAYWSSPSNRTVTTVHGAKNREFDNVFILWTHKLPPDVCQQRRLLYNAVTRAKRNCMLLILGDEKRAQTDPVLKLLGPTQPAFPKNAKARTLSSKKIGT